MKPLPRDAMIVLDADHTSFLKTGLFQMQEIKGTWHFTAHVAIIRWILSSTSSR